MKRFCKVKSQHKNKPTSLVGNFTSALLMCFFAIPLAVSAEESVQINQSTSAQATVQADTEKSQTDTGAADKTDTPAPVTQQNDDIFIPTEEISEDLSVSFPVDI